MQVRRLAALVAASLSLGSSALASSPSLSAQDSATVVVGPDYDAGPLHRFFLGTRYRDAWTTELDLPVLDLNEFAGGLTPEEMGGGQQTISLIFLGANGRRYSFRLIDKDPTPVLPPELRESVARSVLQDQISAQHPLGAIIVHELEEAAGIPHAEPIPMVMPDDPQLGQFREQFAGRAGLMAERPGDEEDDDQLFGDFGNIDDTERILQRLAEEPGQRVDSRAFLHARLLDLLVGDWDRHRGQWTWGRRPGEDRWIPIPEDRDQAFSGLDGVLPSLAYRYQRQLIAFTAEYPDIYNLHHQARALDRQFLAELSRPAWDSVTAAFQSLMSDDVIERAVRRLPDAYFELDGAFLTSALKSRRDALPHASSALYELLALYPEVYLTDQQDEVRITSLPGGDVEVMARTDVGRDPYFTRIFLGSETREIRVFMGRRDDLAVLGGSDRLGIVVRLVGGRGDDEVRYDADVGPVRYYDWEGDNEITGSAPDLDIETKPYDLQERHDEDYEIRPHQGHWTVPRGYAFYSADFGLIARAGATRFGYGFWKDPYASKIDYGAALSSRGRFEVELGIDVFAENSNRHASLELSASQLRIQDFYGFGNQSVGFADPDSSRVFLTEVKVEPRLGLRLSDDVDLGLGLEGRFTHSDSDENPFVDTDPFPAATPVYGSSDFLQLGAFADAHVDTRNRTGAATRGAALEFRGAYYPGLGDVADAYGSVRARGSTYLSAVGAPLEPTLALRAGAAKVWGPPPYFDAAFVGGGESLRGFDTERFAGDAALHGTIELRLFLFQLDVLALGDFGLLGFTEAGRVYVEGASPGGWHTSVGGGAWIAIAGRGNSLVVTWADGEEGGQIYVGFGMPF